MAKKWVLDFDQKYEIHILVKIHDFSFQFFNRSLSNQGVQQKTARSLAKSRRTAKRPTVLESLLYLLTMPIILRNIYFLTHFRIFYRGCIVFF